MAFTQVTREKSKLRLALAGPSGAGKTLSALLMAYGICLLYTSDAADE